MGNSLSAEQTEYGAAYDELYALACANPKMQLSAACVLALDQVQVMHSINRDWWDTRGCANALIRATVMMRAAIDAANK